jgi:hypothetical protein
LTIRNDSGATISGVDAEDPVVSGTSSQLLQSPNRVSALRSGSSAGFLTSLTVGSGTARISQGVFATSPSGGSIQVGPVNCGSVTN